MWNANAAVENLKVEAFFGDHLSGYGDQNVVTVWFWDGTVAYIPEGIGLYFRQLESLLVGYDNKNLGLKEIKRSNFKDMKLLNLLQLHDNFVDHLDVDTFWDIPNLEIFELQNGKLKAIPETIFEKNTKLRRVRMNGNQISYLPKDLFKNNPLIAEVYFDGNKLRSISTDFTELKAISNVNFHGNACIDKGLEDFKDVSQLQQFLYNNC